MPSPVSITTLLASRPCFLAFCETFLLPFADFGSVDSSAFRRLASIFACEGFQLSSSGDNSDLEVFGCQFCSPPTIYRNVSLLPTTSWTAQDTLVNTRKCYAN